MTFTANGKRQAPACQKSVNQAGFVNVMLNLSIVLVKVRSLPGRQWSCILSHPVYAKKYCAHSIKFRVSKIYWCRTRGEMASGCERQWVLDFHCLAAFCVDISL